MFPDFLKDCDVSIFRVRQSMKYSQCRTVRHCIGAVIMVSVTIFKPFIFYSVLVFSEAADNIALMPC
jgi:hypothetical protein